MGIPWHQLLRRTLKRHNMIDQPLLVTGILKELNNVGFSTYSIETALGFSHGYLGKVKKGDKTLGEDKLKLLTDYHAKNCKKVVHQAPVIIHTPAKKNIIPEKELKVTDIKSKSTKEAKLGSLADMMKAARSEQGRQVAQPYSRKKY